MNYKLEIRDGELFVVCNEPEWNGKHDSYAFPVQDIKRNVTEDDLPRSWGVQSNELRVFHPNGGWIASYPLGESYPVSTECRKAANPRNRKCEGCEAARR